MTTRMTTEERQRLAALLGPWSLEPPEEDWDKDRTITLVYRGPEANLTGATIGLAYDSYQHREHLHCWGHTQWYDGAEHHILWNYLPGSSRNNHVASINISTTKSPAQIAKDLTRRLLTPYLATYALAMQGLTAARERHRQQLAQAEELAAILGSQARGGTHLSEESTIYTPGGSTRFRLSPHSVTVEYFTMNYERARLLAKLLTSEAWENARTRE